MSVRPRGSGTFFCQRRRRRLVAAAWVLPFLAGVVGAAFAANVWGQWSVRRRPHQLAWALGLTMYALASLVDALALVSGWNVPLYRAFFVLAAGNVGLLGLGTMLLARAGPSARAMMLFVVLGIAVAALAQFATPLTAQTPVCIGADGCVPLREAGADVGAKPVPFSNPARWAFLLLNVLGGLALIGGALLSWWRTRRAGVLLIGVGAMVPFLGGSLSTLLALELRTLAQLVGIALMFAGYLRGREVAPAAAPRPVEA